MMDWHKNNKVLIVGSAPDALQVKAWDFSVFDTVVVINNAWQLIDAWHYHIHPEDFPIQRRPLTLSSQQKIITYQEYVPAQNQFGGFVYAGGTMAFTAAYWALATLKPQLMAFVGCDMIYPKNTSTHFYGAGTADPLRDDITLQSLEAKATRLQLLAAEQGCCCVNLSQSDESRLVFPRIHLNELKLFNNKQYQSQLNQLQKNIDIMQLKQVKEKEKSLSYFIESGEYWKSLEQFDAAELKSLDASWLRCIVNH